MAMARMGNDREDQIKVQADRIQGLEKSLSFVTKTAKKDYQDMSAKIKKLERERNTLREKLERVKGDGNGKG